MWVRSQQFSEMASPLCAVGSTGLCICQRKQQGREELLLSTSHHLNAKGSKHPPELTGTSGRREDQEKTKPQCRHSLFGAKSEYEEVF